MKFKLDVDSFKTPSYWIHLKCWN